MDFHFFTNALKQYTNFNGRATRTEYWMFRLYHLIILFTLILIGQQSKIVGFVVIIFYLGTLLPSWAIDVRRLHDAGKSGWWVLMPIVGFIFLFLPTETTANQYV